MSSFRRRGASKGKKRNFYQKRADALNRKNGGSGAYNKRNPNHHNHNNNNNNNNEFNTTSHQSRKQRLKEKLQRKQIIDAQDADFGFERYDCGGPKLGWCLNLVETVIPHNENGEEQSGLDLYFIQEDGEMFKASVVYYPYFYIYCDEIYAHSMQQLMRQKFEGFLHQIETIQKVDLDEKNHLSGKQKTYLKLIFLNENDMKSAAKEIQKKIRINQEKRATNQVYSDSFGNNQNNNTRKTDLMAEIIDIREFDVKYITRVCIDLDIRVGKWFSVEPIKELNGCCNVSENKEMDYRPEIKVFAFDIETEKAPLKFPNAEHDRIMMISYMIDNDGYLIVNREIVSQDIDDFEYTPKPEYPGVFTIFNEDNEEQLLRRFFEHIRDERPHCYVQYNGDFFDWPYIEKRAFHYGLDIQSEIGISKDRTDTYVARFAVNLDCYQWVSRDSYLPQGSQSLKAVTRKKLKYNPVELDPELMLPYAYDKPHELATYSVSDAVATYYLFKKYVQDFIFSLCQIIPLNSGDVLRKGTGTLCEALLMVQAKTRNLIAPNKNVDKSLKFYKGHLLDSETYIGGTVEAFESGVFRSDIPYKFKIEPDAIDGLIEEVPNTIRFFIEMECKKSMDEVDEACLERVTTQIVTQLSALKENDGYFITQPLIYHLDVASMYPNIILTNRLQPVAIVNEEICASCDFNRPGKQCQRHLPWKWRGKYFPASKGEYNQLRTQIEYESFDQKAIGASSKLSWYQKNDLKQNPNYKFSFADLREDQQNELLKARVKTYSQKVYKKASETKEEDKSSCVCQRENGFYVDTVRSFRDRRYHYKGLTRQWKGKVKEADNEVDKSNASRMAVMYDSIQLAHKCILNSFYGYVMRKGSRWYNMDMAAITTHIGGNIIRDAHKLCDQIGRPLELDTDGIWTLLPAGFPEVFKIKLKNKEKKLTMEYPGSMLNIRTHQTYTNHQHQELINAQRLQYELRSECSIFFEVDGPYHCMILPASTEQGKMLKKRYAVFNFDGSLEELKGFEIKRRGELQMIKIFQQEVFGTFLRGASLKEIYDKVAQVGKRWLDVLDTKARELSDDELFELITENKNMSKNIEEYGDAKINSLTCARRLAQFLGESVLSGGSLSCKFIVSAKPIGVAVSQRAVPVEIFKAERPVMKQFLKKWLKDSQMTDFDIRSILDWDYYRKRIGNNIQKIVTIPAAMQQITNPLPNLAHPSWLHKKISEQNDKFQQRKITQFFTNQPLQRNRNSKRQSLSRTSHNAPSNVMDIEDFSAPLSIMATQHKRHAKNHNVNDSRMDETFLLDDSLLQDSELQDSELQDTQNENINNSNRNRNRNNNNNKSQIPEPVTVDADFKSDFASWLKQSKQLWKQQKDAKKRYKEKKRKRAHGAVDEFEDHYGGNKRRRVRNKGGADGYFRLQQRLDELYSNSWQIVQIIQLDSPGKFALWIYVNHRLRRIKLQVKRPFYINVNNLENFPRLQSKGKLISRILPRSHIQLNLFQMELKEDEFQCTSQEIGSFLTHPDVEGVYETNVPLLFRIVSSLGCCAAVSHLTEINNSHSTLGFALKELEFRSTTQQNYLQHNTFDMLCVNGGEDSKLSRDSVKYMYLYHSTCKRVNNNDTRSVFAFIYQRKREPHHHYHCKIIAVTPNRKEKLPTPKLEQQAQHLIRHFELDHHPNLKLSVKETRVKTISKAYHECNSFLDEYKLLLNGPTILLLQSAVSLTEIYSKIHMISDNFPIIPFHFNEMDNKYPPLQWYTFATQEMMKNWLVIPEQLAQKKGFARYSHIPIGNMPNDIWSYTSDVFLSRLLSDHKHLWWISEGCRPDLGGFEEDENLFDDEHCNPVINNPGAYDTFCIELEIQHLATNTVLQSDHIQTLELGLGACDAAAGDMAVTDRNIQEEMKENFVKSNIRMDDTSSCTQSFKILKKMVSNWWHDVGRANDANREYADRLLMEFYRWLRTSSSLFYDPLLHRMVHRLMKKVFYQLLAQFKRFGAKIIYASFDKIILETGKNRIGNVVAYIDSCLASITKQDLFEWLIINPTNFWECLIWYDHANFGGYLFQEKEPQSSGEAIEMEPEDKFKLENFDRELEVRWNIASFLPQFAEDSFDVMFGGYLTDVRNEYRRLLGIDREEDELDSLFTQKRSKAIANCKKKQRRKLKKKKKVLRAGSGKHEMDASSDDDEDLDIDMEDDEEEEMFFSDEEMDDGTERKEDDSMALMRNRNNGVDMLTSELKQTFAKYKQHMIENQISQKAFEYVKEIKRKTPKDTTRPNEQADIFPIRPGSHLKLQDPALEFIKYLCLVLSLDDDIKEEVSILRKNLLRLVDVGDFSGCAKFVDPCITFILADVNCFKCKQSRDIDLCRDVFTKPLTLHVNLNDDDGIRDADDNWNVKCQGCGTLYDRDLVESMLLEVVRRRETAYHVQDIVCKSCGKAKEDDMNEYCKCSGTLENKESPKQFEKNIQVFYNIAMHYQFEFLCDTLEWILRDVLN